MNDKVPTNNSILIFFRSYLPLCNVLMVMVGILFTFAVYSGRFSESYEKSLVVALFAVQGAALVFSCFIVAYNAMAQRKDKELFSRITETNSMNMKKMDTLANAVRLINIQSVEQTKSAQDTKLFLNEISAMMEMTVQSVTSSTDVANESHTLVDQGKTAVEKMILAVEEIRRWNDDIFNIVCDSNDRTQEIVQMMQEISNKTKVINDIVFQTKLLSFNASVEAARAGDYGRGFSIVAEEVGKLAGLSGTASREIDAIIAASIQRTQNIVIDATSALSTSFERGKDTIGVGVKVAQTCGNVFDGILKNSQDLLIRLQTIREASKEQSTSIHVIDQAVQKIITINTKNSEQVLKAKYEIEDLKTQLNSAS